jgi:hypothetical protein
MNEWTRKWLEGIASDIEAKYGSEASNRILGDFQNIEEDHDSLKKWFGQFIDGMDKLNDKSFLANVMAARCPCGHSEDGGVEDNIRKNYHESNSLEEFVKRLDNDGLFEDTISLDGNVLIATKKPFSKYGTHDHAEPYSASCHCNLASRTCGPISDIFCHCCTVGFYGKMFKNALGKDVKVEFRDSVISGGKGCTAAIYLPEEKGKNE